VNFTGAKVKKSRALGVALTPKAQKYMKNRPFPPGQHGQRRRRRPSDYGVQLLEKQRMRFQYNISESQMRKAYGQATRMPGSTGDNLVQILETRMDCLVLRAGLAPTIYAARQYVTHGHFQLNGKKATIPSQRLKVGDVISVREKSRKSPIFNEFKGSGPVAPYMAVDDANFSARLEYLPPREEVPIICAEHLVVEFYSR
jgi:small subunit ribosomal protein S4